MNDDQIQSLVSILGNYIPTKQGQELNFACPFPSCSEHDTKKKLAINKTSGEWHCWRCSKSGKKPDYLIMRFGSEFDRQKWFEANKLVDFSALEFFFQDNTPTQVEYQKPKLPKEFISLVGNESLAALRAKNYLTSRGITEDDICRLKLGFCNSGKYADRVVFPSFDEKGYLNYFVARSFAGSGVKYTNPDYPKDQIIFNELLVDFRKPVVLVEGVFDEVVAGSNVIPILGSMLGPDSPLIRKIVEHRTTVYLALDPDAKKKEKKVVDIFLSYGIMVKKIKVAPYKDVGKMTKDEFQKRKEQAVVASVESFLLESFLGV